MEAVKEKVKLERYPAYKDSGVEWLGEIPEHWETIKLGALLKPISIKNKPNLPLLSITREKGVIERNIEDGENHNYIPDDLSGYKLLEKGQFGMNKMKAWQGSYGVSNFTGIVSPAYYIFNFTKEVDPNFFNTAIRSKGYVSFFGSASDGVRIGQWDLSQDRMKQIPFILPPKEEQSAIANFLDDKCGKIDTAIAQKERLIKLLEERKQILIQNTVTKGLDPNVKMKDSGVEWIGEIPEHWEVVPLNKVSTRIDYRGKTPEKVSEGIILVTTKNIKEGKIDYSISREYVKENDYNSIMSRGKPKMGDLLFTMEAPLGHSAVVDKEDVAIAQRIIKFRFEPENFNFYYVNSQIQTDTFQIKLKQEATGSTALGIKASKLHKLRLIKPTLIEQSTISNFISEQSRKFDTLIKLSQEQIQKLKEYKNSLIDAAVTGKIKVG